jgi:hypothetical protein
MMPFDVPLFAAFILSPDARPFTNWRFDVHVGAGIDPGPVFDPNLRRMAITLTQLRIDAVGYIGLTPWIFEVKPDARLSAFGQVQAYCYFFAKQNGVSCQPAIITDTITPDVADLYNHFNIKVFLVQPVGTAGIIQACKLVGEAGCDDLLIPPVSERYPDLE